MLRAFRLALCLACLGLSSVAGAAYAASRTEADLQLVNDNGDVIIQSQSRRQRQPGVRPQCYCVIPPSGPALPAVRKHPAWPVPAVSAAVAAAPTRPVPASSRPTDR